MSIYSRVRSHAVVSIVVVVVTIISAVIAGRAVTKKVAVESAPVLTQVALINTASFREGNLSVSGNGIVESRSQSDLRSQTIAPISAIDVSIGQTVSPGQVLIELSNSDVTAQLAQAQASLALAQGQYQTGAVSLTSAKQTVVDKVRDAYLKTYDAIVTETEPILFNIDGNGGQLTSFSSDSVLNSQITSLDLDFRSQFPQWKAVNDALTVATSSDAFQIAIALTQKNLASADLLLSDISKVLNKLSSTATLSFQASLTPWKASISGSRDAVSASVQAVTSAAQALNTVHSSQDSTAGAQIAVAQAGVDNLRAQLSKTIIRSPIAGKVSALPLRVGELASQGVLVATIIGNDTNLIVKSYISGDDLSKVHVGDMVLIRSNMSNTGTTSALQGIVSNIAPGVDSTTKKAEVDIDVTNSAYSGLIIGQNVSVSILMSQHNTSISSGNASTTYLLPIQDVKIVAGASYVLTVDQNSKIVRNDVSIGSIQGDFIQIVGGLTDDMNIVTPVYELEEGQTVRVQN